MIVKTELPSGNKEKIFVALSIDGEAEFLHVSAWNILRDGPEYLQAIGTNYMLSVSRGIGLSLIRWRDRIKAAWDILRGKYALVDTIDLNEKDALELRDYITMTHGGD